MQIIRKHEAPAGRKESRGGGLAMPARKRARKAAIESQARKYVALHCGHLVTREEIMVYQAFAPNIELIFCERCNDYAREVKHVRSPAPLPEQPLF